MELNDRMIRKLLILCIVVCCWGPAAAQQRDRKPAAAARADSTVVSLDRTTHDFGDIRRRGGDVTADFVINNKGTHPLVITQVLTSCSCLKADFSRKPLAPGTQGTIRFRYEPHKADPGTFYKVIKIHTNAGRLLVTLQGNSIE